MGVGLTVGEEVMRGDWGTEDSESEPIGGRGVFMAMRNAKVTIMRVVVQMCPASCCSVSWRPPNGWKNVNRRRCCPVSVLLSHHRCLETSSRVIIDPSSCCVTPMTTNSQSVVVRRLFATSLWATWHLGCLCGYGNGREGIA